LDTIIGSHGACSLVVKTHGPVRGKHPKQLIIMLHGHSQSANIMMDLASILAPYFKNARFLALQAPYASSTNQDQSVWLQPTENSSAAQLEALRAVAPLVDKFIDDALVADSIDAGNTALIGFAEGALVALHVGLRRRTALAGILSYFGCLVGPNELRDEIKSRPPVYLIQGDSDPSLPACVLVDSISQLMKVGVKANSHLCRGLGRENNKEGIKAGVRFLARIFGIRVEPPRGERKLQFAPIEKIRDWLVR